MRRRLSALAIAALFCWPATAQELGSGISNPPIDPVTLNGPRPKPSLQSDTFAWGANADRLLFPMVPGMPNLTAEAPNLNRTPSDMSVLPYVFGPSLVSDPGRNLDPSLVVPLPPFAGNLVPVSSRPASLPYWHGKCRFAPNPMVVSDAYVGLHNCIHLTVKFSTDGRTVERLIGNESRTLHLPDGALTLWLPSHTGEIEQISMTAGQTYLFHAEGRRWRLTRADRFIVNAQLGAASP